MCRYSIYVNKRLADHLICQALPLMNGVILVLLAGTLSVYGDQLDDLIRATIELNELPSALDTSNGDWQSLEAAQSKGQINSRQVPKRGDFEDLLLESRTVPTGAELDAHEKHAALLEKVIRYGLNQSQFLIDVQVGLQFYRQYL